MLKVIQNDRIAGTVPVPSGAENFPRVRYILRQPSPPTLIEQPMKSDLATMEIVVLNVEKIRHMDMPGRPIERVFFADPDIDLDRVPGFVRWDRRHA